MLYATWSEGYRPGGINRNPLRRRLHPDILTNYELGWKTRFADDRLQLNGAIFLRGVGRHPGLVPGRERHHAGGQRPQGRRARASRSSSTGCRPTTCGSASRSPTTTASSRTTSATGLVDGDADGDITECLVDADTGETIIRAPTGTPLPLTPDFKGNLIARYSFPVGAWESYVQGAFTYQTECRRRSSILVDNATYGDIPSSTYLNLAFGVEKDKYIGRALPGSNATNEDAPLGVTSECTPGVCGVQTVGRAAPAADDRHPVLAELLREARASRPRQEGAPRGAPFS